MSRDILNLIRAADGDEANRRALIAAIDRVGEQSFDSAVAELCVYIQDFVEGYSPREFCKATNLPLPTNAVALTAAAWEPDLLSIVQELGTSDPQAIFLTLLALANSLLAVREELDGAPYLGEFD